MTAKALAVLGLVAIQGVQAAALHSVTRIYTVGPPVQYTPSATSSVATATTSTTAATSVSSSSSSSAAALTRVTKFATVGPPVQATAAAATTPTTTAAPDVAADDDMIMGAAITIPLPVITFQSIGLNPTIHVSWTEHHTHDFSRVTKIDTSDSFTNKKIGPGAAQQHHGWDSEAPAAAEAKDAWSIPVRAPFGAGKRPVVHVNDEADANGYTPPRFHGPVHGVEFPHMKAVEEAFAKRCETDGGDDVPALDLVRRDDNDDDNDVPADAFGGPDNGRFSPKGINPVQHPQHGEMGQTTVEYEHGQKVSSSDSDVYTSTHGHEETGEYSGLGAAEYLKAKKLLDYFTHGKLVAVEDNDVAAAHDASDEIADAVSEILVGNVDAVDNNDKALATKDHHHHYHHHHHSVRHVIKHMLEHSLHSLGRLNITSAPAHALLKHILEAPIVRHGSPLRRIFEVVYDQLKKRAAAKSVAQALRGPTAGVGAGTSGLTTLTTLTRQRSSTTSTTTTTTKSAPAAAAMTPPAELPVDDPEDIEDHPRVRHGHDATIDFTLHPGYEVTHASTWQTADATQTLSVFQATYTSDWDAEQYHAARATARAHEQEMSESEVFDDPDADDDENADTHEELREMGDEEDEMRQTMDEEFEDEFGDDAV